MSQKLTQNSQQEISEKMSLMDLVKDYHCLWKREGEEEEEGL